MTNKIKLGDKVRDKITGYIGIATARAEFLNGCVQYTVTRKLKPGQEISVKKEYEEEEDEKSTNGGPTRFMKGMRGY